MFFVVSHYLKDVSWVNNYTDSYIIYDKMGDLPVDNRHIKMENYGYNLRDYFHFIYTNYNNLPDVVAFLEEDPFSSIDVDRFKRIINNKFFTPIENQRSHPESDAVMFCSDGGFMEINNSWMVLEVYDG